MKIYIKTEIIDIIEKDINENHILKVKLCDYAYRIHCFLGKSIKDYSKFNRRDNILTRLYTRMYPEKKDVSKLVEYETFKLDCTFYTYNYNEKENMIGFENKKKYPKDWNIDWIIEVENIFDEFGYTLRTLLDINCNNRLTIFFKNKYDLNQLNDLFIKYWESFIDRFSYANGFNLYVIIFPEEYIDSNSFEKNSKLYKWISENKIFKEIDYIDY